jgi:anti-anti-sigma regulatory factor
MTISVRGANAFAETWGAAVISLELRYAIDAAGVDDLRRQIRQIGVAPRRLCIECGSVGSIDPVGAALLWLLCIDTERNVGTRMILSDIPAALVARLRTHPLLSFIASGEELFMDPFRATSDSQR